MSLVVLCYETNCTFLCFEKHFHLFRKRYPLFRNRFSFCFEINFFWVSKSISFSFRNRFPLFRNRFPFFRHSSPLFRNRMFFPPMRPPRDVQGRQHITGLSMPERLHRERNRLLRHQRMRQRNFLPVWRQKPVAVHQHQRQIHLWVSSWVHRQLEQLYWCWRMHGRVGLVSRERQVSQLDWFV